MILAEHRHHQQQSTSPAQNDEVNDDERSNIDISENNDRRKCQSTDNKTIVEETAVVHRQPDAHRQIVNDNAEEEEDSSEYSSSDDDDDDDDEDDQNKRISMAKRLPAVPQPRVNNQVSNASNVNINNTNKNVYEGSVVIHQTIYNNTEALDRIDVATPVEKITNGHAKDPEVAVGPKLSNVSSHPLYPFDHDEVTSWFTKRRLIVISGAVLVGLASIILLVCLLIPDAGMDKTEYVPSPPNDTSINNDPTFDGVCIVRRIDWTATAATDKIPLTVTPAKYVIILHTMSATCFTQSQCASTVKGIQDQDMNDWNMSDIRYNFLVGGDGLVYEGRGWKIEGDHTIGYNNRSIGIGFLGNFEYNSPSASQLDKGEKIIKLGVEKKMIDKNYVLVGHRQCVQSNNPGKKLYEIMKKWDNWSPACF